jgi:hypothetical protein
MFFKLVLHVTAGNVLGGNKEDKQFSHQLFFLMITLKSYKFYKVGNRYSSCRWGKISKHKDTVKNFKFTNLEKSLC